MARFYGLQLDKRAPRKAGLIGGYQMFDLLPDNTKPADVGLFNYAYFVAHQDGKEYILPPHELLPNNVRDYLRSFKQLSRERWQDADGVHMTRYNPERARRHPPTPAPDFERRPSPSALAALQGAQEGALVLAYRKSQPRPLIGGKAVAMPTIKMLWWALAWDYEPSRGRMVARLTDAGAFYLDKWEG